MDDFSSFFLTHFLLLNDKPNMATPTVKVRYPKRKRAEISYHESSSDEGEADDEYGVSEETTTRKVCWSIPAVFGSQDVI